MAPRRPEHRRPITAATAAGAMSFVIPSLCLIHLFALSGSLIPFAYTFIVSSITFLFYGYDKMQARNLNWRVKETTLHILGLLGGWPGALAGQHYFQHKTRKTSFLVPFWTIVIGWQAVWWIIWSA